MDDDDIAAEMAALGLPATFVASNQLQRKKQKPKRASSTHQSSFSSELETQPAAHDCHIPAILNTYCTSSSTFENKSTATSMRREEEELFGSTEAGLSTECELNLENRDDHFEFSGTGISATVEELGMLTGQLDEQGAWQAVWDESYTSWFFYNTLTEASQWEVPDGFDWRDRTDLEMEGKEANKIKEDQTMFVTEEEVTVCALPNTVECNSEKIADNETANQTTRRRRRSKKQFGMEGQIEVELHVSSRLGVTAGSTDATSVAKYWHQRYALFSKFDEGIVMDLEGWYSVTPEAIAMHHAQRCRVPVLIDAFTGCGGNTIQFALTCGNVVAIDIDPVKIDLARRNAAVYGVDRKIEFIVGDFLQLAPKLKADIVFLSPPWGGPQYSQEALYDLNTSLKPCSGLDLFKVARQVAPCVVFFVPRNVDMEQLAQLASSLDPPMSFQVERNYLDGKLKSVTAYYGKVVKESCSLGCCL